MLDQEIEYTLPGPVFDRLKEALKCTLCFEILNDPTCTPCGHYFCQSCIMDHLENHRLTSRCPICSKTIKQKNMGPDYRMSHIADIFATFEEIVQRGSPVTGHSRKPAREMKKIKKNEDAVTSSTIKEIEMKKDPKKTREESGSEKVKKNSEGFGLLSRPRGFLANIFKRQEEAAHPLAKKKNKEVKLTDMFFGSDNEERRREVDSPSPETAKKPKKKENQKPVGQNEEVYDEENSHDSFNIVQGPVSKDAPTPPKITSMQKYNDHITVEKGLSELDALTRKNMSDARKTKMKAGGEMSSSEEDEDFKALHKITRGGRRGTKKKENMELCYEERKYKKSSGGMVYQAKVPEKKKPVKKRKKIVIPKNDLNGAPVIATSGIQDYLMVNQFSLPLMIVAF